MLRFLSSLFGGKPVDPGKAPVKHLGIDLGFIDQALIEEEGLPRPQWQLIREWINGNVAPEDVEIAWNEVGLNWLARLRDHLGSPYSVLQSPNFWLLTPQTKEGGFNVLRTGEAAIQELTTWLGPLAQKRGHGKHVILDFTNSDHYYRYISGFYPPGAPLSASSGVFVSKGYMHIALAPSINQRFTLIHELTHNRLAHLPSPRWIGEGLAKTMEHRIGGNNFGRLDRELHQKHKKHWSSETIAAFWTGKSFRDEDGEIVHLSYSLAAILVDILVQDVPGPTFIEFVALARRTDAGQAAANQCLGISLSDLVSTFLGSGDWGPRIEPKIEPRMDANQREEKT